MVDLNPSCGFQVSVKYVTIDFPQVFNAHDM
jgi:hypothetical protein